jgi:hypothetical protein
MRGIAYSQRIWLYPRLLGSAIPLSKLALTVCAATHRHVQIASDMQGLKCRHKLPDHPHSSRRFPSLRPSLGGVVAVLQDSGPASLKAFGSSGAGALATVHPTASVRHGCLAAGFPASCRGLAPRGSFSPIESEPPSGRMGCITQIRLAPHLVPRTTPPPRQRPRPARPRSPGRSDGGAEP